MHSRASSRTRFGKYNRKYCVFMVRARSRSRVFVPHSWVSDGACHATEQWMPHKDSSSARTENILYLNTNTRQRQAQCEPLGDRNGNSCRLWHVTRCAIATFTYCERWQHDGAIWREWNDRKIRCAPCVTHSPSESKVTTCFTTFVFFVSFNSWVVRQAQAFITILLLLGSAPVSCRFVFLPFNFFFLIFAHSLALKQYCMTGRCARCRTDISARCVSHAIRVFYEWTLAHFSSSHFIFTSPFRVSLCVLSEKCSLIFHRSLIHWTVSHIHRKYSCFASDASDDEMSGSNVSTFLAPWKSSARDVFSIGFVWYTFSAKNSHLKIRD